MAKAKKVEQRYNVPVFEALFMTDDINEFYKLIAYDTYNWEYRNPISDEWRKKYREPLETGRIKRPLDILKLEYYLVYELEGGYNRHYPYAIDDPNNLSVEQMAQMVNGVEWTEAYYQYLINSPEKYLGERWLELRAANGLPDMSHKFY